jgi:hypothetical protein
MNRRKNTAGLPEPIHFYAAPAPGKSNYAAIIHKIYLFKKYIFIRTNKEGVGVECANMVLVSGEGTVVVKD